MNLVLYRSGDDTTWLLVPDAVFDELQRAEPKKLNERTKEQEFDWWEYLQIADRLLYNPETGKPREGITQVFTQDYVVEHVEFPAIKRIMTLPQL